MRILVVLAVSWLVVAPEVAKGVCAGDCDGDGRITVDELMTGISISLGETPAADCAAIDVDRDDQVGVNELVGAVAWALEGCNTEVTDDVAASVLATTRALTDFAAEMLIAVNSANNFSGGGASLGGSGGAVFSECPIAGTEQRTCEQLDDAIAQIPIRLDNCTYMTAGVIVSISGSIVLRSSGYCPGVFLPANVRLDFDVTTTERDGEGTLLRTTDLALKGFIREMTFGSDPCGIAGIDLNVSGSVHIETRNAGEINLLLDPSSISANFVPQYGRCEPLIANMLLNGTANIQDASNVAGLEVETGFEQLVLDRNDFVGSGWNVAGVVVADCFRGPASIESTGRLVMGVADTCPTAGTLAVNWGGAKATITHLPDESVTISDQQAAVRSFDSCITIPFSGCAPDRQRQ